MMRTWRLWQGAPAIILPLLLLLSACEGGDDGAIDQPPAEVESQMLAAMGEKNSLLRTGLSPQAEEQSDANMAVFVQDRYGYLVPLAFHWDAKDTKALAQASLQLLVKGGPYRDKLPMGFAATLPEGTTVLNLTVKPDQKLAIVELSKQFASYEPEQERKILESLTWTLTALPDIEQVQLWMDSHKLNEMPVDGTPLDAPLSRQFGINVEKLDTVNYLHSMPVTLYFSSYMENGTPYFVPVTRLIEPLDDPVRATLEQMMEGPLDKRAMAMTFTNETKINDIIRTGDTLTIDLADSMFAEGDAIPAELLKAVVLSVTEQRGIAKVKIKMNGVKDIQSTDQQDYSEPVVRPVVNLAWKD